MFLKSLAPPIHEAAAQSFVIEVFRSASARGKAYWRPDPDETRREHPGSLQDLRQEVRLLPTLFCLPILPTPALFQGAKRTVLVGLRSPAPLCLRYSPT